MRLYSEVNAETRYFVDEILLCMLPLACINVFKLNLMEDLVQEQEASAWLRGLLWNKMFYGVRRELVL